MHVALGKTTYIPVLPSYLYPEPSVRIDGSACTLVPLRIAWNTAGPFFSMVEPDLAVLFALRAQWATTSLRPPESRRRANRSGLLRGA